MVSRIPDLILLALSCYAMTFVIVSSSLFEPFRLRFSKKTPWLRVGNNKHLIYCRMCTGFWCALLICNTDYTMLLPVYGLAYFLATQER